MSEVGEVPQGPQPEQELPQPRLEDMDEFKKLAPEQQQYLLSLRERMRSEAMNPQQVVSRSIHEMGFWEGMKETVRPHLRKQKELYVKDLKAYASAALSLVPVLGEGKGLGSGLFGLAKPVETAWRDVKLGQLTFEPAVRLSKAIKAGKDGMRAARGIKTVDAMRAMVDADRIIGGSPKIGLGVRLKESLVPLKAGLAGKNEATRVLGKEFSDSASHGAKVMATRLGVEGIQAAQQAKRLAKAEAYLNVKKAVDAKNASTHWINFPTKWARSAKGEVIARWKSMKAGKEAGKAVNEAVKAAVDPNKKKVVQWMEGGVKRAAPTVIEATRFGKFQAFFDHWLNFTPDVPVWLSTTTGIMEFLGAHGIDAIPAVLQLARNRYKQVMVSKDMALDVMKYTATRGLQKMADRKQAAEMFAPTPVGVA